jgi:hypothetical protein
MYALPIHIWICSVGMGPYYILSKKFNARYYRQSLIVEIKMSTNGCSI